MKKIIIKYLLYIYNIYIVDDTLNVLKDFAKPYIKILLYAHNFYIWLFSIIFFPIFVIDMKIRSIINKNLNK